MTATGASARAQVAPLEPRAGLPSALEQMLSKGRVRATLAMLGPAFVASIAYVDPGNFATNFQGGAQFGYLLLWVVLAANIIAMLIQYLSAKLGVRPGVVLRVLEREPFGGPLWVEVGGQRRAMGTLLPHLVHGAVES